MTDPGIHRAVAGDWRAVRTARLRALTEDAYAFASTLERELTLDEAAWRSRAQRPGQYWADLDGEPVGLVGVYWPDDGADPDLVSMWVAQEARGRGIADALMSAVLNYLRQQGAGRVLLWVADGNDRAEAFYRRVGFEATGGTQRIRSGEPATEHEMALRLG